MRLVAVRIRDYRLHRDLAVAFDPRFTVITGPNQSGKSTLAEALHRALFLPVKTGGELLKGMQPSPFSGDPDVELAFEAAGERWTLRKRFAATRGSVSLLDGRGRSLQGDEAEERLAQLVGTAAVSRNRAAADQLRERWGHLWVWQGSASSNPLALSAAAYDHDRLVERLQAGADLGVTSPLDLAVLEDIQQRWEAVFTAGGASRAPQVRRGSALQQAISAEQEAQESFQAIEALIAQQVEEEQRFVSAVERLERIAAALPPLRRQRQELERRLAHSRELEARVNGQQPLLDAVLRELAPRSQDRLQLLQERQRAEALAAAQAPRMARLAALREELPLLEAGRLGSQQRLEALQQASAEALDAGRRIEARLNRLRLRQEQAQLHGRLTELVQLRQRLSGLEEALAALPAVEAPAVERLRQLEAAARAAQVRAESLSAGLEVIQAGQQLRLDGEWLEAGSSRLLSRAALLEVGDDVVLRLLPGGGTSTAEAAQAVLRADQALADALSPYQLATVEEVARAERRRSELLAERQSVQGRIRSGGDAVKLRLRLQAVAQELRALPPASPPSGAIEADSQADAASPEALQSSIGDLEQELRQAQQRRDQATAAERAQQLQLRQAMAAVERHSQVIVAAEQELRQQQNQLLETNTRIEALIQRHGTPEALDAGIAGLEQRRDGLRLAIEALRAELTALDAVGLRAEQQRLDQAIERLQQEETAATEARIRAEERLHGDGRRDPQAEREQKLAELESRRLERQRLDQEARMLTLLRRLLAEEQNAMGSQYAAPLSGRILRYLGPVFPEPPQASLRYDARDGFQGLEWRRGEEAAFGFAALSTGAREQFAAALRLAMAEVLAEAYDGCLPVLFDDAFANSDPERQRGVHGMLALAADQGLQVILLSCDPERCAAIAAHHIRLDPQPAGTQKS